ncbi:hypothetical protein SNEBB_011416 [Seison nebaliae]|nr:hypothetical protein SNEBB_011416 [Seison nebaliae]
MYLFPYVITVILIISVRQGRTKVKEKLVIKCSKYNYYRCGISFMRTKPVNYTMTDGLKPVKMDDYRFDKQLRLFSIEKISYILAMNTEYMGNKKSISTSDMVKKPGGYLLVIPITAEFFGRELKKAVKYAIKKYKPVMCFGFCQQSLVGGSMNLRTYNPTSTIRTTTIKQIYW